VATAAGPEPAYRDQLAVWDTAWQERRPPVNSFARRCAKRWFPLLGSRRRVLELGCGAGADALFLARHGCEVVATDFARTALLATGSLASGSGLAITVEPVDLRTGVLPFVDHRNQGGDDGHGVQLASGLEELGPCFIKLGQLLSTRPDRLPAGYIRALSRLQDTIQPVPAERIIQIVQSELHKPIDELFQCFDSSRRPDVLLTWRGRFEIMVALTADPAPPAVPAQGHRLAIARNSRQTTPVG
jgi:SAM-dependent methyltransferase